MGGNEWGSCNLGEEEVSLLKWLQLERVGYKQVGLGYVEEGYNRLGFRCFNVRLKSLG